MDSKEKVEVLVSCYDAFKKGELKNEPARLLCERILEDLEREEFECPSRTMQVRSFKPGLMNATTMTLGPMGLGVS